MVSTGVGDIFSVHSLFLDFFFAGDRNWLVENNKVEIL